MLDAAKKRHLSVKIMVDGQSDADVTKLPIQTLAKGAEKVRWEITNMYVIDMFNANNALTYCFLLISL